MRFYFQDRNGKRKEITMEEANTMLSKIQMMDAVDRLRNSKKEVCYMFENGFVAIGV